MDLQGRTINGEPWRYGQKTRPQLVEDCVAVLGLNPSTPLASAPSTGSELSLSDCTVADSSGTLHSSVPPETPTVTLRAPPPQVSGSAHKSPGLTPSTADAAASAQVRNNLIAGRKQASGDPFGNEGGLFQALSYSGSF